MKNFTIAIEETMHLVCGTKITDFYNVTVLASDDEEALRMATKLVNGELISIKVLKSEDRIRI